MRSDRRGEQPTAVVVVAVAVAVVAVEAKPGPSDSIRRASVAEYKVRFYLMSVEGLASGFGISKLS